MLRAQCFRFVIVTLFIALVGCANPAQSSTPASPIAARATAPLAAPPISPPPAPTSAANAITQPPALASTEQLGTATVPPSPTEDMLSTMATMAALAPPTSTPTIDPATLPTMPAETTSTLLSLPLKIKGTYISQIAISPDYANDRTILVADNERRLYHSTDAGASWRSQELGYIQTLAFSPDYAHDHTIVAGLLGGDQAPNGELSVQVQLSINRGQSWQVLSSPGTVPRLGGMQLFISPAYAQDRTLFATLTGWSGASDDPIIGHLHRSTDNGASWTLIETPCQANQLAISPSYQQDQTLYLGCYAVGRSSSNGLGLHRSSDNGTSWQRLTWGEVSSLVLVPTTPQPTLFIHAARSSDGGVTWADPQQNIGRVVDIVVSPDYAADHTLLALTSLTPNEGALQSLIRSVDGGDTWALVIAKLSTSSDGPTALLAVGRAAASKLIILIGQRDQLWIIRQ